MCQNLVGFGPMSSYVLICDGVIIFFFLCTIDESIKGAASLRRYGITFDGNINVKYKTPPVTNMFLL